MLACVDVHYRVKGAVAACLLFRDWTDDVSTWERVESIPHVLPYVTGQFYQRELPCLLSVLEHISDPLEAIVIDGYVWLGEDRPGLGAYLYESLQRNVPVIAVAKTHFPAAPAIAVRRGGSRRPLHVTAVGLDRNMAAQHLEAMHGPYRIPTLLRRVDQLCRGQQRASSF
jgi:deoxyribonuclease V